MVDPVLPVVCNTEEQLASEVPKLLGFVEVAFAIKMCPLDLSSEETEVIFVPRGPGKPRTVAPSLLKLAHTSN